MTCCDGDKGEMVSKTPKIIDLEPTGISRSARLANKPKHKYFVFAKLSLSVIGKCEVDKNPHTFITRANQYTQKIYSHFNGTLNYYGPMVFAEN